MNAVKSSSPTDQDPDPSTTTSVSPDAGPDPEATTSRRHPLHAPTPPASLARFRSASASSRPGPPPATSPAPTSTATTVAATATAHDTRPGPQKTKSSRRRSALPFSFPFFQVSSNSSVTSLVPSTAEGKPIPLDDSTAAYRTLALRELNSNFPSPVARHQYSKPSGPQSSTYSQPVIVRTYSGPTASRGHSRSNSHSARRGTISTTSTSVSYVSPPAHSRPAGARQNGGLLNMGRGNAKKKMPWPFRHAQEAQHPADRLPPYEAFSFKTIMANLQAQSNEMDKALDGIAEIYARSRYSLSNQYEVHVAPHGSGSSFTSSVPSSSMRRRGQARNPHSQSGPTLQAIQSDEDDNSASARSHRKRRNTGRRRSGAYSTLETIMSSSRSSEEDKTKKKSAAELTDQVRGRASPKPGPSGRKSPASSTKSDGAGKKDEDSSKNLTRKRSKSFANAIILADTTKNQPTGEASPRNSSAALVSEPSKPQTSSSHLEIRTTPNELFGDASTQGSQPDQSDSSDQTVTQLLQSLTPREEPAATSSLMSGLGNWVPFKAAFSNVAATSSSGATPGSPSHAEGSLRELLKTVDDKQKGKSAEHVER